MGSESRRCVYCETGGEIELIRWGQFNLYRRHNVSSDFRALRVIDRILRRQRGPEWVEFSDVATFCEAKEHLKGLYPLESHGENLMGLWKLSRFNFVSPRVALTRIGGLMNRHLAAIRRRHERAIRSMLERMSETEFADSDLSITPFLNKRVLICEARESESNLLQEIPKEESSMSFEIGRELGEQLKAFFRTDRSASELLPADPTPPEPRPSLKETFLKFLQGKERPALPTLKLSFAKKTDRPDPQPHPPGFLSARALSPVPRTPAGPVPKGQLVKLGAATSREFPTKPRPPLAPRPRPDEVISIARVLQEGLMKHCLPFDTALKLRDPEREKDKLDTKSSSLSNKKFSKSPATHRVLFSRPGCSTAKKTKKSLITEYLTRETNILTPPKRNRVPSLPPQKKPEPEPLKTISGRNWSKTSPFAPDSAKTAQRSAFKRSGELRPEAFAFNGLAIKRCRSSFSKEL